ncbi:LACT-domain-containing protein [Meredithblackwellia eburnea MCA 4105]
MKRRNAPKKIDVSPERSTNNLENTFKDKAPPASASNSPAKQTTRVPLLAHKVPLDQGGLLDPQVNLFSDGTARISAPSTPWHELDLSDSFMNAVHVPVVPKSVWQKRRWFFLFGGFLGIFLGWLFTEGDPLAALSNVDFESFNFDMQKLVADLPSISNVMNVSEIFQPGREWLNSKTTSFVVGREVAARGQKKTHSVILIPGIVSSGLESWSTNPEAAPMFRKRIWASTAMLRAILTSKDTWVAAMSLDPDTGLDQEGYKVRAAQGLDAASSFMPGYWIWQKVIENLAALDYDHNDMQLFSYDWRLAYFNLEVRDRYFSRLKYQIELNLAVNDKKTVLVSHSMGALVTLWFMKWVEAEGFGGGGPDWCEKHVEAWVNIAGTLLGVPKAMSALLSGEMRDTVEINAAGVYLLERYFSRTERAKLFRSWAGAASMMLKGGNDVWGDDDAAPDDFPNATLSGGNIYYFRPEVYGNTSEISEQTVHPNLTLNDATTYILENVPASYQRMISANFSFGFERDPEQLKRNDQDHRKWTNPLEIRLPTAPSMSIYCLYGTGKETERGYFYQHGGYEQDEVTVAGSPVCFDEQCRNNTPRAPLDMPLSRRTWVDSSVTLENQVPKVRSGVVFNDGDGTVSLLSLGGMCVEGWKRDLYNPGKSKIVTHEIKHEPLALDVRGGPTTADHVDILGSSEMNEAVMDIVTGHGDRVQDRFHSKIQQYAAKIRWNGR